MGQIFSRTQEQSLQVSQDTNFNIPSSVSDDNTDIQPDSSVPTGGDRSTGSSYRRSLRKNILKYISPSNLRNRPSSAGSGSGDVGRSWRKHRRWSNAKHSQGGHEDGSSYPGPSSEGSRNEPSISSVRKGKQREADLTVDEHESSIGSIVDETRNAYPLSLLESSVSSSPIIQSLSTTTDVDISSHHRPDNITSEEITTECRSDATSHHWSPLPGEETNSSLYPPALQRQVPAQPPPAAEPPQVLSLPALAPPQQQSVGLPQRQFPPPGTLVVVQGIVHTTDVSRPTTSTPLTPSNAAEPVVHPDSSGSISEQNFPRSRNRLSSLLRPRSSSRPMSALINDSLPISSSAVSEPEHTPFTDSQSRFSINDPNYTTENTVERSESTSQPTASGAANSSPLISSSSIEVLGTLLSVAAAATAASLLTGSSEPILSSGLAPHSGPAPPDPPPPTLPTYGAQQDSSIFPDTTAAGRSERMRQAWGTIRERLGLRPSPSPTDDILRRSHNQPPGAVDNLSSTSQGDEVSLGSPIDTRELMLAEMARAFNIGLGLNGLGGLAPGNVVTDSRDSDNTSNAVQSTAVSEGLPNSLSQTLSTESLSTTLPPEGSFERFLVDLQNELRSALTQPESGVDLQQHSAPTEIPHVEIQRHSLHADNESVANSSQAPVVRVNNSEDPPSSTECDEGDCTSIPSLEDVSDSDSALEDDDYEGNDYADDDFRSAEQRSLNDDNRQTPREEQLSNTSGAGRIDASGRINWWRLYRFPPVISPSPETWRQPLGAHTNQSLSAPSDYAIRSTDSPISPLEPVASTEITLPAPITNQRNAQGVNQASQNSVVPVIVVGLQSVNSEWRPDLPQRSTEEGQDSTNQPTQETSAVDNTDNSDDLDGLDEHQQRASMGNDSEDVRGQGRPRGWHSRAADAIRNLRHGRRHAGSDLGSRVPVVTPGSRTFLIYVIGGYYPPDHNIVTGGPDILDSFEALLELADLLGQVKPPTVSKDEIEKSGLEIIKASELAQREKNGKVSSNCTDRCLICLDDYEPEDPIRVMSCRHAFHKGCVDEWLQKGRNNCPACRSTGVPTDGHPANFPPRV